jgi:hypothetical protein
LALYQSANEERIMALILCLKPLKMLQTNTKLIALIKIKWHLRSQNKAAAAQASGRLAKEITPVVIPQKKGDPIVITQDEHPRATTIEALTKLKPIVRPDGTVTAGNASGVNDGACALLLASEEAVKKHGLKPQSENYWHVNCRGTTTHYGYWSSASLTKITQTLRNEY